MNFNIDIAIFVGFLAVNLMIGLYYSRGTNTIREYAIGNRDFSTGAIVATIVATFITGSSFFVDLSKTYSDGLLFVIPCFGWCIQFFILTFFIIPRMGEFIGSLSIAEVMGNLYGKKVRFITAISGILSSVGVIAVQFKVFGTLFNYFLGIDSTYAILIASTIVIIYSAFGGIRAVTHTDVLQFFTFGFVVPLIGVIIWNHFKDAGLTLSDGFNKPIFTLNKVYELKGEKLINFIFLIIYFAFPKIGHIHFQRISMGRDIQQIKTAFLISSFLFVFIILAIIWIPFLVYSINPNLEANELTSYIINNYTYTGLKGMIIIGVSAMAMSSADSFINGSAVLFGHDLRTVCNIKIDDLILTKIFSLILGIAALFLALSTNDLLAIVMMAASLYLPIVSVPALLTILGFRSSQTSVLIAMSAGFTTVMVWKLLPTTIDCIIPAMSANFIFLIGSHYLLKQPGGWVGIKDRSPLDKAKKYRVDIVRRLHQSISEFKFIDFCKRTAPSNELMYTGLGIYFILYTITTMYSTQAALLKENGRIILTIYQIMMCSGTVMAMYPIWPPRIKHEIIVQVAWNITIFYMLIFFSCFFVMESNFGQLQFTIFTINMIITAILVGWKLSVGMMIVGFYLSVQFYKFYAGVEYLDISLGSPQFVFMYSLMLIGSALIIFLKPKQDYLEATEGKVETLETEVSNLDHEVTGLSGKVTGLCSQVINLNEQVEYYSEQVADKNKEIERLGATAQKILNNVNHELRLPIGNVINFSDMLNETLGKSDNKLVKELAKEVYDNSNRVSTMILNMLDLATLDVKKIDLQKTMINFSELVTDRVRRCQKIYLREKNIEFKLDIEPEIMIAVDPNYIRQTVDNLVINAISFSKEGLITVSVSKKVISGQSKQAVFTVTDQGVGIPEAELVDIFTPFKMGSNTESKACGRGVGLALCKSAIEAHGGQITAASKEEVGATLQFMLPF